MGLRVADYPISRRVLQNEKRLMHTDTPRARVSAQIAAAALAGTVFGVADAALVASGLAGARGAFQFVPARIWIVSPVVWVLLAVATAAVLSPLLKRRSAIGMCASLGAIFLGVRLRAHPLLLLAALAILLALLALAGRWMLRWMTRPRRGIAAAVIGTLTVCAIFAVTSPLPPASAAPRHDGGDPNVIVIFLDTVRYDAVFEAGGRVSHDLPSLARLRGESTAFTRAFAAASWTLPSSLSAMTGLPAHQLGVGFDSQVYDRAEPTLAERFRRRGYRTAAVISNSFLNAGSG